MFGLDRPSRRILVLWWYPTSATLRPAIRHHLHFLDSSTRGHRVVYHNVADGATSWLRHFHFDVIVLHTTLLCLRLTESHRRDRQRLSWLRESKALKIALPQDEYDHSEILDEWLHELGVSVIGSNFGTEVRSLLYPIMADRARFLRCLTGYIDEPTASRITPHLKPVAQRPLDIVYRAAHLPFWFGSQGQLKHRIADIVAERAADLGLRCDISTRPEDTITSDHWFHFLASARATIGCESGSSVLDRRGEMQAQVRRLQEGHPELTFEGASRRMPPGWDDHRFFALGPRHLEAVITRTAQVLVEGHYDGVLQPHRHYIPLRRDFADLDEVLYKIRDDALLEAMTARAYEEVYRSGRHTYAQFAQQLDDVIQEQAPSATARIPWPLAQCLMRLRFGATKVGGWACRSAARMKKWVGAVEWRAILLSPLARLLHYRALAMLLLRERLLRRAIRRGFYCGLGRLLVGDLLKLVVLRRLRMDTGPDPVPFQIRLTASPDTIRFESIPGPTDNAAPDEIDWQSVEENFAAGTVRSIVWDHSGVSAAVRYHAGSFRAGDLWLPAGSVHSFKGLCALGTPDPKLAIALLQHAAYAEAMRQPASATIARCDVR